MFGKGGELEGLIQRCSSGKGPVPLGNNQFVMLHHARYCIRKPLGSGHSRDHGDERAKHDPFAVQWPDLV